MTKHVYKFCFSTILCIAFSCAQNDDGIMETSNTLIGNLRIYDIGNFNDAGDILLRFTLSSSRATDEVAVFLNKSANVKFEPLISNSLGELGTSIKLEVGPGEFYEQALDKDLLDTDGEPISNGIPYDLFVVAANSSGDILEIQKASILLSNINPLVGQFRGVWSDNLDGSLPVSVNLEFDNNTFQGSFFYTNIFEPCCGGKDDGQISLSVALGDSIPDFRFDQLLNRFSVRDSCVGVYFGTGRVVKFTRIELAYQGSDCVGDHLGSLILDKQ